MKHLTEQLWQGISTFNLPGICMSLYLTDTVWTPSSFGTKWTAYRPSSTSLISASSVTPPGDVTVAERSNDVIPSGGGRKNNSYNVIFLLFGILL